MYARECVTFCKDIVSQPVAIVTEKIVQPNGWQNQRLNSFPSSIAYAACMWVSKSRRRFTFLASLGVLRFVKQPKLC